MESDVTRGAGHHLFTVHNTLNWSPKWGSVNNGLRHNSGHSSSSSRVWPKRSRATPLLQLQQWWSHATAAAPAVVEPYHVVQLQQCWSHTTWCNSSSGGAMPRGATPAAVEPYHVFNSCSGRTIPRGAAPAVVHPYHVVQLQRWWSHTTWCSSSCCWAIPRGVAPAVVEPYHVVQLQQWWSHTTWCSSSSCGAIPRGAAPAAVEPFHVVQLKQWWSHNTWCSHISGGAIPRGAAKAVVEPRNFYSSSSGSATPLLPLQLWWSHTSFAAPAVVEPDHYCSPSCGGATWRSFIVCCCYLPPVNGPQNYRIKPAWRHRLLKNKIDPRKRP